MEKLQPLKEAFKVETDPKLTSPKPALTRMEVWGSAIIVFAFSALLFLPEIVSLFGIPDYTIVGELGAIVGILIKALGWTKGYRANNLWKWATWILDKLGFSKYKGINVK